jgi:hypothetical protein
MTNFAAQASAVSAIILLVDYLIGVTVGMFGGLVFGSVREGHSMSMLEQAPDPVSAGARALLMPFTRDDDGYLRSLPPGRGAAPRGSRADGSSGSPGQGVNR